MNQEELDLLDRESRVFNAFQAAIDLLNPNPEARDTAKVQELLDFLADEYERTRGALRNLIVANRQRAIQHGCAAH